MTNSTSETGWLAAWNRFWFSACDAHSLALVRIFTGLAMVLRTTDMLGLHGIGQQRFMIPCRPLMPHSGMLDAWHLPYPWLDWLPLPNAFWDARIQEVALLLAILVMLGICTRWSLLASSMLWTYLHFLSQWNYFHHILCLIITLWVLTFSGCGRHYSFDALVADPSKRRSPTTVLPIRLLQFLFCTMYFSTFLWKANDGWLTGEIFRMFDEIGSIRGPFAHLTLALVSYQFLSLTTLAIEGLFPFFVWLTPTRKWCIAAAVILHFFIDATMRVQSYSWQMWALLIAFIYPSAGATVVLYDGMCGMCRRSRRVTALLDWFFRISWLDFRREEVRSLVPQISDDSLQREMHVITPDGQTTSGFAGWREILMRFPLTFLPALLLYVPPIPWIGAKVYAFVASRRKVVCAVDPRPRPEPTWRASLERAAHRMQTQDRTA